MRKIGPLERMVLARKKRKPSRFEEFLRASTWKSSAFRIILCIAIIVGSHWFGDVFNWFYAAIGSAARVSDAQSRYAIGFLTAAGIFGLCGELLGWVALIIKWRRNRS